MVGNSPSSNGLEPQTAIKEAKEAYLASLIEERACTVTSEQDNTTTRTTYFVNNINTEYEVVLETYQNGSLDSENVFDSGLVSQTLQNEKTYTARNLRGDILVKSDVFGSEENYSYDLFGKPTSTITPDLGYNGEVHEGSLQYLRARYYDTETGVFITRDTYRGEDKDIQSQNRYTYVGNNPANSNDPSGHFFSSIWNGITNAWNGLKQGVKKVANAVGGFISNTWNNLTGNNKSTGSFKKTGTPVKRPSFTSPGSSNSKATGIVKGAAALAGAAQSILKVEKEYKTIQQQLSDKEAQWRSQGLSASQIDAKRIEFVKKYCEDLGFTTAETSAMLKKLGLAETQANASGTKQAESPNKPWYEQVWDDAMDELGKFGNWAWGAITSFGDIVKQFGSWVWDIITTPEKLLTAIAVVAAVIGIGALIVALVPFIGAVTTGASAMAAIAGLVNIASISTTITFVTLTIKQIAGYEMNTWDDIAIAIATITAAGTQMLTALASIFDSWTELKHQGTGNTNSQIEGTSYDANKLYKTQPDSLTTRRGVDMYKEQITANGPNSVDPIPVRVHNGQALIVDGHHRYQAFVELGYDRVPIQYIHENQINSIFGRTLQDLLDNMFKSMWGE